MPIDRMDALRAKASENAVAEATCAGSSAILMKLEKLRSLNSALEDAQMQHLATNDRKLSKKIEKLVGDIAKEGQVARNMIVTFGHETEGLEAKGAINASEKAMRRNVFENLVRKLEEVTKGSWEMQKQHEANVTKQTEKRLKMRFSDQSGKSTMSDEDAHRIAKILVDNGDEEQVFLLARDELDHATRTRDAVREIEREMRELYLLFCDLNTLALEQREGLEAARDNVLRTEANVRAGQKALEDARKMQKRCCTVM